MKSSEEKPKKEEVPTAVAVLEQLVTPGTVFEYPEKPIIFSNSKQLAVKSLEVNICSTESHDMAVLHKLHSQTRSFES